VRSSRTAKVRTPEAAAASCQAGGEGDESLTGLAGTGGQERAFTRAIHARGDAARIRNLLTVPHQTASRR